ncbi:hypothetical protein [Nocardia miyunensis]|uniref:hypothetical protein n=1 Tax=Nocardia miyunensis TaxID=282684 RepID=UPI000B21AD35|nr:hypothetical protein [Nocardia miyunensis]
MFRYAVRKDALSVNPVRESQLTKNIEAKGRTCGARDITIEELWFMLSAVRTPRLPCLRKLSRAECNRGTPVKSYTAPTVADYCESTDLADWVTLLAATGLRRTQTLGLLWSDTISTTALHVIGKVGNPRWGGAARLSSLPDRESEVTVLVVTFGACGNSQCRNHTTPAYALRIADLPKRRRVLEVGCSSACVESRRSSTSWRDLERTGSLQSQVRPRKPRCKLGVGHRAVR